MPTLARRPAAQQERERLQARRLRAGELFAIGVRQAEVARQLGVSPRPLACGTPAGGQVGWMRCAAADRPARTPRCPTCSSPRSNMPGRPADAFAAYHGHLGPLMRRSGGP
jgi:hypothetical protein